MSLYDDVVAYGAGTSDAFSVDMVHADVLGANPTATKQQVRDICIATFRPLGNDYFKTGKQIGTGTLPALKKAFQTFVDNPDTTEYDALTDLMDTYQTEMGF